MSTVLQIANFFLVLFEVIVLFNLIIIVHELGHFLAARWRGLKIEEFGVWFGKALWKKEINGVVYSLGSIPAGGFVKLPQLAPMDIIEGEADVPRETLPPISALDKTIVAFAGPLFSFLFALVLACVVWQVGKPVQEIDTTTLIGSVTPGSPAEKAGLLPGDRILEVDGNPVRGFKEMTKSVIWYIMRSEGETIRFKIDRDGQILTKESGWVIPRESEIDTVQPNTPAAAAGLAKGDIVTHVNGKILFSPENFQELLGGKEDAPIYLTLVRGTAWLNLTLEPKLAEVKDGKPEVRAGIAWSSRGWGRAGLRKVMISPGMTSKIKEIQPGSPAAEAGLAPGDILTHLNGKRLFQPWALHEVITKQPKEPVYLTFKRGSEWRNTTLQPKPAPAKKETKAADKEEKFEELTGIEWDPMITHTYPRPIQQITDSLNGIRNMLGALFSSKSGVKAQHFSGPLGIGNIYYQMLLSPEGWRLALAFSVFFNVNLAVLNMLPFPVLDGGHIVLAFIESIRRKPVNIKVLEIIQSACALLLIGFILYVSFYDSHDILLPWIKSLFGRFH